MNYSDFTEINEDYVTGKVYGNCVVLGWNGKQHGKKLYVLQCNICKEDSELFGDGLFVSGKSNLDKIQMPDGYTETTASFNIDKVISIYESYGGLRVGREK